MTARTDEELTELIGPVGLDEYKAAADHARPKLDEWIGALRGLSDDDLFGECRRWIYEGALVQRFQRMNFEDVHCRGTACFFEARRRGVEAGHDRNCGGSIYARAHAAVMRSQGYTPTSDGTCSCPVSVTRTGGNTR